MFSDFSLASSENLAPMTIMTMMITTTFNEDNSFTKQKKENTLLTQNRNVAKLIIHCWLNFVHLTRVRLWMWHGRNVFKSVSNNITDRIICILILFVGKKHIQWHDMGDFKMRAYKIKMKLNKNKCKNSLCFFLCVCWKLTENVHKCCSASPEKKNK